MNFRADVHHDLLLETENCSDCGFAIISHPIEMLNWRCARDSKLQPLLRRTEMAKTVTTPRIITLTVRRLRRMAAKIENGERSTSDAELLLSWADELNAQHASTGRTDKSQAARRRKARKAAKAKR